MPHGPAGCPDKQALLYLLLALVHVEHLCESLADKNTYLQIQTVLYEHVCLVFLCAACKKLEIFGK